MIALHTVINHSTQRLYISQLQKLKLTKEPGEDVNLFSDKVLSIARHIGGLSSIPIPDLHTLIYQCYEGSSTPTFASTVTNLLADCFKSTPSAENWESNVAYLKQLYRDLVTRSCWVAVKNMKEKSDGTAAKASVKSLKAEIQRLKKTASSGTAKNTELVCYWCGEPGHAKPNCPNLEQPKKYTGGKGETKGRSTNNNQGASNSNAKAAPQDGDSHTKSINGSAHKWCATCKKWNTGAKAHLTADHVKRTPAASTTAAVATTAVANVAQVNPNPVLTFVAGYIGTNVDNDYEMVPNEPDYLTVDLQLLEEEEREREQWLVTDEHSKYCLVCQEPVEDVDGHESSVTHFQNMLLANMSVWFAEKAEAEEAAKAEEEENKTWSLVAKKYQHKKRNSKQTNLDLKSIAGQF